MSLATGTAAPDFSLASQFGERVQASSLWNRRAVALVFFPLAFSGTCTRELAELCDDRDFFDAHGVEVVGISVDSTASLRAWSEQEGYDVTLLADFWPHGEVARAYEAFLPEKGYAARATFLIDESGIIRDVISSDPGEARPLSAYHEAIAALRSGR